MPIEKYKPHSQRRFAPVEQIECEQLVEYLQIKGLLFSHIAQETPAGKFIEGKWLPNFQTLRRNKRMGVARGVPDYLILIPKDNKGEIFKLLFIEMKRVQGGVVKPEQANWLDKLGKVEGVTAVVCRGFDEAKEVIDAQLKFR